MNLKLFRSIFGGSKRKSVTIRQSSLGKICISLHAIQSLVERKVITVTGVREAKVTVVNLSPGTGVRIQIYASNSDNLPSLNQQVRDVIREEILKITGIQLKKVQVIVDKIISDKPRVR